MAAAHSVVSIVMLLLVGQHSFSLEIPLASDVALVKGTAAPQYSKFVLNKATQSSVGEVVEMYSLSLVSL